MYRYCECEGVVSVQVLCCDCIDVSRLNTKFQVMTVDMSLFLCHVTSYCGTVQSVNQYSPQ